MATNVSHDTDSADSIGGNFRAEDLSSDDLRQLTVMSEREREIIRALESGGQRLLIGPRGSGKSTYLRLAYYGALDDDRALPVYVNYSKSISLEPNFKVSANALPLFRQWVLALIVDGAARAMGELRQSPAEHVKDYIVEAQALVSAVERRAINEAPATEFDISNVIEFLESCVESTGRKRAVLLLDDAAHAFASEQQREFFEIFGGLRSRVVSAKAAVYPGVTSYTPRFHVGHDAQLIDVWLRPDEPNLTDIMREIAQKRLPPDVFAELDGRESLFDYMALASFGLPRTMITMLAQVVEALKTAKLRSNFSLTDAAIAETADNAIKVFTSLQAKLPRYKYFVEVGQELIDATVNAIREYNDQRAIEGGGRANRILLQEPVGAEVARILGFLEYAGVVRQLPGTVSQGDRSFKTVLPHYALLLNRTALGLGRNPSAAGAAEALTSKQHTVRVRRQLSTLLGPDYVERCRLNLGACPACGRERENAEAKFCFNCGNSLPQVSVYEELLNTKIQVLPLTKAMMQRISQSADFDRVKDILLDEESERLRAIDYIGPVRATNIRAIAEEFVYE